MCISQHIAECCKVVFVSRGPIYTAKNFLSIIPCKVPFKIFELGHEKMCLMSYANNKGADQPAHPRSLISAFIVLCLDSMGRVKRIWYLSPMRAAKVQARLRIRAVSPEPPLLSHTNSEPRGTFRQKARTLAPLNGWACADKMCHDGMPEDTNSLDGARIIS